jgi:hypothetical protein
MRRIASILELGALALTFLVAGCATDENDVGTLPAEGAIAVEAEGTLARGFTPGEHGWEPVRYRVIDGERVAEGDNLVGEVRAAPPAGGARANIVVGRRWPGARINYSIHPLLAGANAQEIREAIRHWEANTSFRFTESATGDYVEFVPGTPGVPACFSPVGRQGGHQLLRVAPSGCGTPTLIHELGHAIGLYHEHNRADRDDFISVQWAAVRPDFYYAFDKVAAQDGTPLGPYDFTSVMHYGSTSFSLLQNPASTTIVAKNGATIAPGAGLSAQDRGAAWLLADVDTPIKRGWSVWGPVMGAPLEREELLGDGRFIRCEHGILAWHPSYGFQPIAGGAIAGKWSAHIAELGHPVSVVEQRPGFRLQRFERGTIYELGNSGFFLGRELADKYEALGGPGGAPDFLTGDQRAEAGGVVAHTWTHTLTFAAAAGAHEAHGQVRDKLNSVGLAQTGFPNTDLAGARDGGERLHFEHGAIYRNPRSNRSWWLHGPIFERWIAQSWDYGPLRFPDSDVNTSDNGRGTYQHFEGGTVYVKNGASSAFIVAGELRARFWAEGAENGRLGFPRGEYQCSAGCTGNVRWEEKQEFDGGTVFHNLLDNGTWIVWRLVQPPRHFP